MKRVPLTTLGLLVSLPILRFGSQFFEKGPNYFGNQVTDVSGALLLARQLDSMGSLFESQTITGAPNGYSIVGPLRLILAFNTGFLWSATRFVSPTNALALYCLLGLFVTGIAARWFARTLGISETGSLICGVLAQALPWLTEKSANHVTYTYCGLVLIPVGLSLKALNSTSTLKFIMIISTAAGCLTIDPYLGVFSLLASYLTIAFGHSNVRIRRFAWILSVIVIFAGVLFDQRSLGFLDALVKTLNSRGLGKNELIMPGKLLDYVTPQPGHLIFGGRKMTEIDRDFLADYVNYFGFINLALAAIALVLTYKHKDRSWRTLSYVALSFVVLSLEFNIQEWSWMPASSLWLIAPGLRVVSRFGLVAQLIATVFTARGIDWILGRISYKHFTRPAVACVILLASLVDTDPLTGLHNRANTESYSDLGSNLTDSDIVAILPDGPYRTTRWIGLASLIESKTTNSEIDSSILQSLTALVRDQQFVEAWCEAQRLGITHILLVRGAEVGAIPGWETESSKLKLDDPSKFLWIADAISPVLHPEYQVKVSLYEVVKDQITQNLNCS
jgi:hypothetical protein